MTSIADRIGLGSDVREVRLGRSFGSSGSSAFHSIRYDFKPASVDTTKMAAVDIGEKNQVTVTVPHIEGSGTAHTIFKGSKKPSQKECVLIIDHSTGEITLEKLSYNIQLKKTRAEGSSKIRSSTPVDHSSKKLSPPSKHSPPQKMSHSPNQKSLWLSHSYHSPSQRSPSKNHRSPTSQPSPSMPCLVPPPNSNSRSTPQNLKEVGMPVITNEDSTEMGEVPEMSESSSSDSSSSAASSTSDSSDSESDNEKRQPQPWSHPSGQTNGTTCSSAGSHHTANVLPSMPKFSQLSEDLQLSESESD